MRFKSVLLKEMAESCEEVKEIILAQIVSYLTFDGHLSEDLKSFYLSSKNKETLQLFQKMIYKNFRLKGKYETGQGFGESYKYRVHSKEIGEFLSEQGVPKGNKVKKRFLVPSWIKENKEYARAYLQTGFDCEGSIWFEKQPKIRFGICKIEKNIENGIAFLNELRCLLGVFDVETTKPWVIKANIRKDGDKTKGLYFKIKQKSIKQYIQQIGFSDKFKKKRASSCINRFGYL